MNMGAKPGLPIHRLTRAQAFKLGTLMSAEYTASGLDNVKFAEKANAQLAFGFNISSQVIAQTAKDLEIPPNKPRTTRQNITVGDCIGLVQRVAALEDQVSKLAMFIKQKAW